MAPQKAASEIIFMPALAIFRFVADTRKMMFRYSALCGTSSDAVDAVNLEIAWGEISGGA